jgi:hypothetical protein
MTRTHILTAALLIFGAFTGLALGQVPFTDGLMPAPLPQPGACLIQNKDGWQWAPCKTPTYDDCKNWGATEEIMAVVQGIDGYKTEHMLVVGRRCTEWKS